MTRSEFSRAVTIAESEADLTNGEIGHLFGCALPNFKPVVSTLRAVAKLLRDHIQFNGEWDQEGLNECWQACRYKVHIVGGDSDDAELLREALV
jgi:hypothetical protein